MSAAFARNARRFWSARKDGGPRHSVSEVVALLAFIRIATALLVAGIVLTGAYAEEEAGLKRGNPLWGIPVANLRGTGERPLFSASRRPPPPPFVAPPVIASALPPPPPAEPKRPPLALLGTIIGEGTEIAVFLDEATKDIVHLKVGQDRGGWTLRSVHGRQVDFERNHRIATLAFNRDVDEQRLAKPPVDVAALSNPDMESYRAALRQRRGR
jgi:hypothetical protein